VGCFRKIPRQRLFPSGDETDDLFWKILLDKRQKTTDNKICWFLKEARKIKNDIT